MSENDNPTKNGEPLISVIVPIYKVEAYLRKCLDSILAQTYENLEIILVDDGSPDGCPAICDEYAKKDPRIVVIHKKNGGLGSARNAALDICRGEYIGFVDSDDWIEPDMYRVMLEKMLENDCDITACGWANDSGSGVRITQNEAVLNTKEIFKGHVTSPDICFVVWNKLYKRKIWDGLRMPRRIPTQDVYVFADIISRCEKAVFLPETYYHYTSRDEGAVLSGFNPGKLAAIASFRRLYNYYRDNLPELYTYVALGTANVTAKRMTAILRQDLYFKYRRIYRRLEILLKKEYEAAKPYISEKTIERGFVEYAATHPTKFFLRNFLHYLREIKNKLKRK